MTSTICPDCGAHLDGITCQEIFDEFLALEFTDPAFGAVHFLTVACFMIQHRRYSVAAQTWIKQQLHAYLEKGMPIEQIRSRAEQEADQARRDWKVMRQPGDPLPPSIPWKMTIADIKAGFTDAASYCGLVTRWAKLTLEQMNG